MTLPLPYNETLVPADLARYGAVLSAREAEALRLRWAGIVYAQIGYRLGVTPTRAHALVLHACRFLAEAKQQADAPPPNEDTP